MIDKKELTSENLIEEKFCKVIQTLDHYPMNEDQMKLLMSLLMASKEMPDGLQEALNEEFLWKMLNKRLEICFDFTMCDKSKFFLMNICKSAGNVVMYLTYLQWWCFKKEINHIDLDDIFCTRIFPNGFFKESDLQNIWDNCKIKNHKGSDNLLDYQDCMKSIRFNKFQHNVKLINN